MKICILTQNLGHNYGGILQAYALQTFLKKEGHEVETVRHGGNQTINFRKILSILKQAIKKYLLCQKVNEVVPDWMKKRQQNRIYQHLHHFIQYHIEQTPNIKNFEKWNCLV
jgi:hypothetical protein